jgi:hypothetical protein
VNCGTSTTWALIWLGHQPKIPGASVNNAVIAIPRACVFMLIAHSFALVSIAGRKRRWYLEPRRLLLRVGGAEL